MSELIRTVAEWEAVAGTPTARRAIHPSGLDVADYIASGESTATLLAQELDIGTYPHVIDFGAGDGRIALPMARLGYRVTAVDASPTMLAKLEDRSNVELELYLADGTIPLLLEADAAYAIAVLIHHRHEDAATIIGNLARAIRPGGRLILDLPLYEEPREPANWTDVAVWTFPELLDLVDTLELEVLEAVINPGIFDHRTPHPLTLTILERPA